MQARIPDLDAPSADGERAGLGRLPEVRQAPPWFRIAFPSVADLIFIALLLSLAYGPLAQRLLGDADIGWHIRNGEQVLTTHVLPRTDTFSSTMNGHPWYAWEWLYDIGVGLLHQKSGLNGVVFFTALIISFTFTGVFWWMLKRGIGIPFALLLFLLCACASTIHFLARPHVVTWLFAFVWFCILDAYERGRTRVTRLYFLPLLMLAWVNLHGGFVLGFVLLGIYLIAGAFEILTSADSAERKLGHRRLKELGVVTVACGLASFINPYGYHLHAHVYGYLTNHFLMSHIDEFQSPNFHGVAQQCFALLLLVTIVAFATHRSKVRSSQVIVTLFAVYSGLYAARNIPVASILLTMVASPLCAEWLSETGSSSTSLLRNLTARVNHFSERMAQMQIPLRGHLWPVIAVVIGSWVCLQHGYFGSKKLMDAHFDAQRFPVRAADSLLGEHAPQPIFTLDSWGGYLIYRLYPEFKVVVDDRHDLYGEAFLKDYLKAIHAEPGWDLPLEQWNVNVILLPVSSPLSTVLKEDARWSSMRDDGVSILFRRR